MIHADGSAPRPCGDKKGKMKRKMKDAPIQGGQLPIPPDSTSGLDAQEAGPGSVGRMPRRMSTPPQRGPTKDTGPRR